ncbi:MAG: DUF1178 family protein [Variovorax sp.]
MKVLSLQCAHGHGFEGWFGSGEAFETQHASGLVECPLCGDRGITKLLTAPRLNLSGSKAPAKAEEKSTTSTVSGATAEPSMEARWLGTMRKMLANTEDVGERFADEARRMHHGETEERGIRGQATREEAAALLEEGIPVMSLPVPAALKETLQ